MQKYLDKLKEIINNNDIQDNAPWYYYELCSSFPDEQISLKDFHEWFKPLIIQKIRDVYNIHKSRCFLSIPITGQEEKARKTIADTINILKERFPYSTFYSPFEVAPLEYMPDSYYMGKDIEQLMKCNIIIQFDGWQESKGCRVENFVADTYHIQKISINNLIKF